MDSQAQVLELRKAMKQTKDRRLYERYQAVALHLEGHTAPEIGRIIGRDRKTVGTYIAAYQEGGIAGLDSRPHPGRPRRLNAAQEAELAQTVATELPSEVGFRGLSNWTLALACEYVWKKWGIRYTLKGMSLILKRQGLSHTRPTYTLAKADPEKQRVFREETFPRLKKNS